ncbi:MAG TPA: hypothetical protein VG056_08075 [Pirellulales bacterium]|nr:hypothetical protein [Pirellulales bacterium]
MSAGPPQSAFAAPLSVGGPSVNESKGYSDSGAYVSGPHPGAGDPYIESVSGFTTDHTKAGDHQTTGLPRLSGAPDSLAYSAYGYHDASGMPAFQPVRTDGTESMPLPTPKMGVDSYDLHSDVLAISEGSGGGGQTISVSGGDWSISFVIPYSQPESAANGVHSGYTSQISNDAPYTLALPDSPPPSMRPTGSNPEGVGIAIPFAISELSTGTQSNQSAAPTSQHQTAESAAVAATSAKAALPIATSSIPVGTTALHATSISTTLSPGSPSNQPVPPWVHNGSSFDGRSRIDPKSVAGNNQYASVTSPALMSAFRASGANLRTAKPSLAEVPINLRQVEQALETVMSEIEVLGAGLSHWFNDVHLAEMAAALALGAGTAVYLRRRGVREAMQPDDEPSSSWLFARLQPIPGE